MGQDFPHAAVWPFFLNRSLGTTNVPNDSSAEAEICVPKLSKKSNLKWHPMLSTPRRRSSSVQRSLARKSTSDMSGLSEISLSSSRERSTLIAHLQSELILYTA